MGARLTKADHKRIAWVKSFESGRKWFLKMRAKRGEKPGTQKYYAQALKRFSEYVNMNPDEIIETYKAELKEDLNQAMEEWNEKLVLYVPWLVDKRGVARSTAATRFNAVKSFFKHNAAIGLTATTPGTRLYFQ